MTEEGYHAWIGRGIAAGRSVSCNPLLAFQSSIARQNPALNKRGYEGELASYEQGLKHCLQDTHPEGWGKLHQAIGNAHYDRGYGHSRPRPYWYEAIKSYKEALKTLTAEAFSEFHLEVLQNLIKVYGNLGEAEKVQVLLAEGTDILGRLLQETPSDGYKILLSRKFVSFAQLRVDELAQKGNLCEALELAEQRKNLSLYWLYCRWSESEDSPNYDQMQQLLQPLPEAPQLNHRDQSVAIIYWHISPAAITTFILRHNQPPIIVRAKNGGTDKPLSIALNSGRSPQPPFTRGAKSDDSILPLETDAKSENSIPLFLRGARGDLPELGERSSYRQLIDFENWMTTWRNKENWQEEMPNRLKTLAETLNIEGILQHLKGVSQLILVPHRDLHLLPLHALFTDNFTIKYLPSIKVGLDRVAWASPNRKPPKLNTSLLSVENPTEDLRYARPESETICKLYPKAHRITESDATRTAVKAALAKNFGIFHFTGHGTHNLDQPAQSALLLANKEPLTLKDILELDLSSYDLVCLSACETNFTSKVGLIDEFIGLASGFVAAGSNNVIGSLWNVNDSSTAYLMTKFHEILLKSPNNSDVASALKAAQDWLRNATNKELVQFPVERSQSRNARMETVKQKPDDKPYASPYYWAGFCAIGL